MIAEVVGDATESVTSGKVQQKRAWFILLTCATLCGGNLKPKRIRNGQTVGAPVCGLCNAKSSWYIFRTAEIRSGMIYRSNILKMHVEHGRLLNPYLLHPRQLVHKKGTRSTNLGGIQVCCSNNKGPFRTHRINIKICSKVVRVLGDLWSVRLF